MHPRPFLGIRLHLGYFRAGDEQRPGGEMRARLDGIEPPTGFEPRHAAEPEIGRSALRSRIEIPTSQRSRRA
jgi:hypothetical protein